MPRFQEVRGILFPDVPWFKKDHIERTLDYYPKDGDIIIASYPKTGTTWLQYILLQITSRGEFFPAFNDVLERVAPFMEMVGPECIDSLEGLRMYKHHYRYDMVKKNPKAKVVYIFRNPEDTIVSYYHFLQNAREEKLDLEEFYEEFLTGNIEYGSYFEHVLSYFNHKNDDNLLLVSYEELHSNPKEGILRIAKFLGEEYFQSLSEDESVLNKVVKNTSFEHMKKNLKLELPHNHPKHSSDQSTNTVNFFRKGAVGDGKNLLSPEQVKQLQMKMTETLKDSEKGN